MMKRPTVEEMDEANKLYDKAIGVIARELAYDLKDKLSAMPKAKRLRIVNNRSEFALTFFPSAFEADCLSDLQLATIEIFFCHLIEAESLT